MTAIHLSHQKASISCSSEHLQYVVGILKKNGNIVLFDTVNEKDDKPRFEMNGPENKSSSLIKRKDMEARNTLGMAFGSKKRKLDIKSATENMIHISSLKTVEDAIESDMQMVAEVHDQEVGGQETVDRIIPKYNLQADNVENVYDLFDIIPKNEWKSIYIKDILKMKTLDELREHFTNKGLPCSYVVDRIYHHIQDMGNNAGGSNNVSNLNRLKKLVYLTCLMKLYLSPDKTITRLYNPLVDFYDPDSSTGQAYQQKQSQNYFQDHRENVSRLSLYLGKPPNAIRMLMKFMEITYKKGSEPSANPNLATSTSDTITNGPTEGNSKDVPSANLTEIKTFRWTDKQRDKLLAYILTLTLIIDHYCLDPALIAQDLKMSGTKITSMLKELGCKIENKKRDGVLTRIARLVVPLAFPKKTR